MSIHRYAARTDANQRQVISALEAAGAKVEVIRQPLDLLVGMNGKWLLLEVKNREARGKPTKAQEAFYERFPGYPWAQVDGAEAALRCLGMLRGQA